MDCDHQPSGTPHLVWVCNASPAVAPALVSRMEVTRELRKLGWCVTLVMVGPAGRQTIQGLEVFCIPKPRLYFLGYCAYYSRLFRLLARELATIDVILFPQMATLWVLPLRLVRRLTGRQRPLLVKDTRDLVVPHRNWKNRLRVLFHGLMHGLANRWADGQTTITPRMADLVRIPAHQLWGIWPSGVNPARFAPAQVARRWPLADEPVHLIYVGVLLHERNLLLLCQAVEKAHAEGMAFILTLVGDGPARADLEEFAHQTAGRIRVAPPVPHDQVPQWLAQAHVGVTALFSPDQEIFQASSPIKLFEYMAAGLPVLATRIVCHTDVVGDGRYAFWADQADMQSLLAALRLVWQNRDSLGEMGRQAAEAAQAWTWHESAKKLKTSLEYGLAKYG